MEQTEAGMFRKQILITRQQTDRLNKEAVRTGLFKSEIIRRAIDYYLGSDNK